MITNEERALIAFRNKYLGYRPWQLAKVRGTETIMHEFTSWPYEKDGKVYVMARVIGDPATNREYECRKQIALTGWGHMRQRGYREGWQAGQAYMRFVQSEYLKAKETN